MLWAVDGWGVRVSIGVKIAACGNSVWTLEVGSGLVTLWTCEASYSFVRQARGSSGCTAPSE
jgi:hypothetical protein